MAAAVCFSVVVKCWNWRRAGQRPGRYWNKRGAARDEASAELGFAREDEQRLARSIREAEMLELSLQKDDAGRRTPAW